MDRIDLEVLEKRDLIRACKLVGYKGWIISLDEEDPGKLRGRIYSKINPSGTDWREQYESALNLLDIEYSDGSTDEDLRRKLYEYNCEMVEEKISDMPDKEKKKLTKQIEDELDNETMNMLQKVANQRGKVTGAGGVLALQGGAITLTGSNLGICMLLTSGLSSISSIVGVTFPFAAYAGAAAVGGKILGAASVLANPFVAAPILGASLYYAYTKKRDKQYIRLAGVNYLVESKKRLLGVK